MTQKEEVQAVRELCDKIGYGNTMEIASALWRKNLKEIGLNSGAFIPTIKAFLTKEGKQVAESTCKQYDEIIMD